MPESPKDRTSPDKPENEARLERIAAMQLAITDLLAGSVAPAEAIPRALRSICEALGWDAGAFWTPDDSRELRCHSTWTADPHRFARFLSASGAAAMTSPTGLPERVWASGAAAWIENVARDAKIPRAGAAMEEGPGGALAFPIQAGGEFLGVMEFFCRAPRPTDDQMLRLMNAIGLQLGRYLRDRRIQRTLEENEARKSAMLEAALDSIVGVDAEGNITEWNTAAEKTFGYSRAEALGRPLVELIVPPRLREEHLRGFTRQIATGQSAILGRHVETWARRKDGSEFPTELTVVRLKLDGPAAFTAYLRDLTERHSAEAERRRLLERERAALAAAELERNRLRDVFAQSPYLALVTEGPEHRVEFANPAAFEVFRISPEVVGKPLATAYPEFAAAGYLQLFSYVYQTGEVLSGREMPLTNENWGDVTRYFDYVIQPLRNEQGEIARVAAHGVEVTDKVLARQRLEQALRVRDDFVSVASHELRNPVNTLKLQIASSLLRLESGREPLDPAAMCDRLKRMAATMETLSGLLERLLDVTKMTSGRLTLEPEEFDLGDLAREVVGRLSDQASARETIVHQSGSMAVRWDRQRIGEVISNLLTNAYKYGEGKPVSITLAGLDGAVRVDVRDQGVGIRPEDQARIFERFEQVRPDTRRGFGGFGLGLWICRQIIEAHGGSIRVESSPGCGSTFSFELPRQAVPQPETKTAP